MQDKLRLSSAPKLTMPSHDPLGSWFKDTCLVSRGAIEISAKEELS